MTNQTKVLPCWLDEAELDELQDDPAWQGLSGNRVGAELKDLRPPWKSTRSPQRQYKRISSG